VAGRDGADPTSASGQRSSDVVANGMAEFQQGLADLKGGRIKNPNPDAPV
jgi:hypothetical protein